MSISTVVTFSEMVFSSARRYRSMKYSWQNRQAPFLRPSMVEACNETVAVRDGAAEREDTQSLQSHQMAAAASTAQAQHTAWSESCA